MLVGVMWCFILVISVCQEVSRGKVRLLCCAGLESTASILTFQPQSASCPPTASARGAEMDGRHKNKRTFIYLQLTSHILSFVLKAEVGCWMDAKVNTSAGNGLSPWKAPLDVKQPNGNSHTHTHGTEGDGCFINQQEVYSFSWHWMAFFSGAFFIFFSPHFFFTSINTIALIQGGFFSTTPKTYSTLDNGAKSVTKTCNHIIDSSIRVCFLSAPL